MKEKNNNPWRDNMSKSEYKLNLVALDDPKVAAKIVEVFSREEFNAEVDLETPEDGGTNVYIEGDPCLFEEIKKFSNRYAVDMRVSVFDVIKGDGVEEEYDENEEDITCEEICIVESQRILVFEGAEEEYDEDDGDFLPEVYSYTVTCPDAESAQKMESELKELSIRLPEPSDQDDEYERLIREKLGVLDVNMCWSSTDKDVTLDADTRVLNEIKKLSTKLSMKVEVEGHPKDLSYDEAKEEGLFVEFNFPEDPSPEELKAEWLKK
jgi:hypothetical protein